MEKTNNAVVEMANAVAEDAVAYDTSTVGGYSGHTVNVLVTNFDGVANATAEEGRKRRRGEASDAESSTTTLDSSSNTTRESAVEWVQLPRGPQGGAVRRNRGALAVAAAASRAFAPFVVNVPCLRDVERCVEFVTAFREATIDPGAFAQWMFLTSEPVLVLVRKKPKDLRDHIKKLYTARYENLAVALSDRTPFFNLTQQFTLPNFKLLRAMFSGDAAERMTAASAKKHLICCFCKRQFSLKNNARMYIAKETETRAHEHPDTLHPFLARILTENLWVWAPCRFGR
jgi:hypothetical protein